MTCDKCLGTTVKIIRDASGLSFGLCECAEITRASVWEQMNPTFSWFNAIYKRGHDDGKIEFDSGWPKGSVGEKLTNDALADSYKRGQLDAFKRAMEIIAPCLMTIKGDWHIYDCDLADEIRSEINKLEV